MIHIYNTIICYHYHLLLKVIMLATAREPYLSENYLLCLAHSIIRQGCEPAYSILYKGFQQKYVKTQKVFHLTLS